MMVDHDALLRSWKEISEKLRQHWAELANEEFHSFDGDMNQLVELIQRKTGEARSIVEQYLDQLKVSTASAVERATDDVREYAHESQEQIEEGTRLAVEALREGRKMAAEYARRRPGATMAVCVGVGIVAGLMLGLSARRR
ncbi:MAG TPA: hypothetical protein VMR25_11415 [Planctomycetaceae bacterium]|jgi:ElaB/YqjD/DUF883 family membrane-anchored ribosome-binding protein|nr:hypothetical protein [Planctomycetaceae bacterium]